MGTGGRVISRRTGEIGGFQMSFQEQFSITIMTRDQCMQDTYLIFDCVCCGGGF